MSGELIPEDIRQFIIAHIDSIAQLEALVLLRREPATGWDTSVIAKRLYVSEGQAAEGLEGLCGAGLLSVDEGRYRFNAASAELGQLVDRLLDLYAHHLIPVTNLVHGKPRVRAFADAFKFRKDS